MPNFSNSVFSSAAMRALLARELAATAPILAGVYGNHGLLLRAHASAPATLPAHLLGNMVELVVEQQRLRGNVDCKPGSLPFANDSFKLLIVQHVFEQLDEPEACAAELARVLAPEGVALVLGFNPAGTWRPWLALKTGRGTARLRLRSAHFWQQQLARQQVDTLQVRFPGTLLPHSNAASDSANGVPTSGLLARFGSSWLLLARKRRSVLTPLRLRPGARVAMNPRLAPGAQRTLTQRACA